MLRDNVSLHATVALLLLIFNAFSYIYVDHLSSFVYCKILSVHDC